MNRKRIKPILTQNAFDFSAAEAHSGALQRRNLCGPMAMLFYREPLNPVAGKGCYLYDQQGREFLDAYNNVPCLGHSHPRVLQAVSKQLYQLNIHTRYLNDELHRYAEKLLGSFAMMDRPRLVLTCTGSEANDLALRLARIATGRYGVLVSEAAYHGNTDLTASVSPSSYKSGCSPAWLGTFAPTPATAGEDVSQSIASEFESARAKVQQSGHDFAALLVDSVLSSDGVFTHPKGFLKNLSDCMHDSGGLVIADEVQPGFARTGESFWGFQRHEVVPDIVTLGKPMGNGYPIAAVVAGESLFAAAAEQFGYFNTFAGTNAAIAAANAVWDTLHEENIADRVARTGDYLQSLLLDVQAQSEPITQVRGCGLYWGVDLQSPDEHRSDADYTSHVINQLMMRGVLVGAAGSCGATLKIRPPLCFGRCEADRLCTTLLGVLSSP